MSSKASSRVEKKNKLPRGVIVLALLLWVGAFISAGVTLVPTATLEQFNLPRSMLLVYALALGVLGYGLIQLRRWAWIATILFVFVNINFLLVIAFDQGTPQYVGLGLLVAAAVYLLRPTIRARFLGGAARR